MAVSLEAEASASTNLTLALAASAAAATLMLAGGIAGFFYAYSSSVMFGLNAIDPRDAIVAMKGINATVRNAVFAPAFFGTPVAALVTAFLFFRLGRAAAAGAMALAGLVYLLGAFAPTALVNVPMNDALAGLVVPESLQEAARIWADYAERWTWWNTLRTTFSAGSLLLVGYALFAAGSRR